MSKEQRNEKPHLESSRESSRFGKEVKIGITVIALLLIVLGAVVTLRVMGFIGGSTEEEVVVAQNDKSPKTTDIKTEPAKDIRPKMPPAPPPTVVPAKAASLQPAKPADPLLDRWKTNESTTSKPSIANHGPGLGAPPLVPDPPKPPVPERQNRYTRDLPGDKDKNLVELKSPAGESTVTDNRYSRYNVAVESGDRYSNSNGSRYDIAPAPSPDTPSSSPRYTPSFASNNPGGSNNPGPMPPAPPPSKQYSDRQYGENDYQRPSSMPSYRNNELRPNELRGNDLRNTAEIRPRSLPNYSPTPAKREDGKYVIQPNDSYWTISEKLYGTGAYFKALAAWNRGKVDDVENLKPGAVIQAPDVAQLERSFPDLCPKPERRDAMISQTHSQTRTVSSRGSYRGGGRVYTVVEGDTLFNIARYELGKASRWAEIYELNRDVLGKDFNYLTPGTKLLLPDGEKSTEIMAEPSRDVFRR